ncbi:unnamed protein product [Effrenium voratum]|nr:unnamed protein product [Effrenium voratum]
MEGMEGLEGNLLGKAVAMEGKALDGKAMDGKKMALAAPRRRENEEEAMQAEHKDAEMEQHAELKLELRLQKEETNQAMDLVASRQNFFLKQMSEMQAQQYEKEQLLRNELEAKHMEMAELVKCLAESRGFSEEEASAAGRR